MTTRDWIFYFGYPLALLLMMYVILPGFDRLFAAIRLAMARRRRRVAADMEERSKRMALRLEAIREEERNR